MSLLLPVSPRDPVSEGTRSNWFATIGPACLPAVVGYIAAVAALAVIGLASGAASGADSVLARVAEVGAVGWLAAHHVPLIIDGAPLGVLPLLPTLLLGALIARGAAGAAIRSGIHKPVEAGWLAGAIAGTHGVVGTGLALLATPATITADPVRAAVWCALVAGVAAGVGLARPCGLLPAVLHRAPGWVQPGLVISAWGLAVLLTAGLAVVVIGLGVSAPEAFQMSGSDAGSAFGLILLSIGYLPNAAIAGLSWLAGSGFSIGALSVSPVAMVAAPVPTLPLLAALPQGPVQPWWGVVLAIPLLTGAAMGRRCAAAAPDLLGRLRVLGVAVAVLALGSAVLAALAGGRLGTAAFDPVDIASGSLTVALLGATLLGGCAVTLLGAQAASTPVDGAEDALSTPADSGAGTRTAGGDDEPRAEQDDKVGPAKPACSPGNDSSGNDSPGDGAPENEGPQDGP
ncbi:MAG: DUF6350 family protein [Actinomycetota bacterium]|nr:DUF6350 family protein [Actinomycetota bacterium]